MDLQKGKMFPVDEELLEICQEILDSGMSEDQWADIEDFDALQNPCWCGGYSAYHEAFVFDFCPDHEEEGYEVVLSLEEVKQIHSGFKTEFATIPKPDSAATG